LLNKKEVVLLPRKKDHKGVGSAIVSGSEKKTEKKCQKKDMGNYSGGLALKNRAGELNLREYRKARKGCCEGGARRGHGGGTGGGWTEGLFPSLVGKRFT